MITRDVLDTIKPAPWMFCYCLECKARYSVDSAEWWEWEDHEALLCHRCSEPVVLASERVIVDVVAE